MYEKTTNFLCLTMQRYGEKPGCANPFNESPRFFSKASHLYFLSTSPVRDRSSIVHR